MQKLSFQANNIKSVFDYGQIRLVEVNAGIKALFRS